jgi:hypothetical protein
MGCCTNLTTKIKSHSKAISQHLTDKIQEIRIKNKIKFWFKKKQMLNKQLYNLHLENSKKNGESYGI